MSINGEFALDAVGGNPRPATPLALSSTDAGQQNSIRHSQSNSPRSSAWGPIAASSSIATFREQEACITETPHFHERLYIPPSPPKVVSANERKDEGGFITEKWSKRGEAGYGAAAATNAALVETSEGHKQILFRQLLAELHAERAARIKAESEVKKLRQQLTQNDPENYEQWDEDPDNSGTTTTMATTPSLMNQPAPFRTIPIVDMSLPLADVAFEIGQACRQVGFFYIVNHGLSPDVIANTVDFSKRFFELPVLTKMEVDSAKSRSGARGYFALGGEDLNAKDGTRDLVAEGQGIGRGKKFQGDWKEGFDCGREISPDDPEYSMSTMVDGNYWPRENALPGFREAIMSYQKGVRQIGNALMEAFAVGLGLETNFFVERTQKPMATLRLLHYPPQGNQNLSDLSKIGCGAHTDYGLATILLQDEVGGLQIRNSADQWVDAPPIPGSFVVNIGDMLSMWSNGRYASTVHRVVNMTGKERYSIPFFLNPNVGTTVECLPTCQRKGESPRHKSESSHEILSRRYRGSFVHLRGRASVE
jgi:isopenicillin N synthase-like dioxygenase